MSPDGWYKTYKWAQEIQLILWYLWLGTGEFCLSTGKRRQWKRRWKKDHFALFQSLSHLFRPAPFVKCGRFFFWRLILKDFIQVKKTKVEFVVVCSRPPRALTWDQAPQGRGGGGKVACERRRISGRRFSPIGSGWRLRSPDFLSQTTARLASLAFFPTAEPDVRLVLHKTSYNIRTFQAVVVQWTS